eukprot:COSAG01_NODE_1976_length_8750_cov_16.090625_8_plen_183_part_00
MVRVRDDVPATLPVHGYVDHGIDRHICRTHIRHGSRRIPRQMLHSHVDGSQQPAARTCDCTQCGDVDGQACGLLQLGAVDFERDGEQQLQILCPVVEPNRDELAGAVLTLHIDTACAPQMAPLSHWLDENSGWRNRRKPRNHQAKHQETLRRSTLHGRIAMAHLSVGLKHLRGCFGREPQVA